MPLVHGILGFNSAAPVFETFLIDIRQDCWDTINVFIYEKEIFPVLKN